MKKWYIDEVFAIPYVMYLGKGGATILGPCKIVDEYPADIQENRIDSLMMIASAHGLSPSLRILGGKIYANINGVSFLVGSDDDFERKCVELKNYKSPAPIDLTERLKRIENAYIRRI